MRQNVTSCIDYLSASVPIDFGNELYHALKNTFPDAEFPEPRRAGRWSHFQTIRPGAYVFNNRTVDEFGREHVEHGRTFFDLKGEALFNLGMEGLIRFLDGMSMVEDWKFSRVDLVLDWEQPAIMIADLMGDSPKFFATSWKKRTWSGQNSGGGGVYYGSREGGRQLVVYDKAVQTNSEVPKLRFELRHYGEQEHAGTAFRGVFGGPPWGDDIGGTPLAREPTNISAAIASIVCGSTDFVDRRGRSAKWWAELKKVAEV